MQLTEQWTETNALDGPPPSEVACTSTIALSKLEIDDDGVSSPSDAATAVSHPITPISHEIKRVKFDLITEGLNSYKADNYEKARENFQHAFEMGPDVPFPSFDDTMTEERLNLRVCLSTLRAAP